MTPSTSSSSQCACDYSKARLVENVNISSSTYVLYDDRLSWNCSHYCCQQKIVSGRTGRLVQLSQSLQLFDFLVNSGAIPKLSPDNNACPWIALKSVDSTNYYWYNDAETISSGSVKISSSADADSLYGIKAWEYAIRPAGALPGDTVSACRDSSLGINSFNSWPEASGRAAAVLCECKYDHKKKQS